MTPCRRDGALGSGCGPREQGAPPNLRGDRPAHGKDSNASLHPVPSVRAPDSWSPQSLSGPVLCWERVWGIPGAPSSLPSGSSVSPLGFLSPTSGLPGVPLPGGPGCASGSCDRRRKLRRNNSTPAFLLEGMKVLVSSHNFGAPRQLPPRGPAAAPPSPVPGARLPRGPYKAHGSPAAESHRCPAPGPCAPTRSPSPSRSPPAPKQGWQPRFRCLIKAARGGCGGRAELATRLRPGARGATGCAGQRAGGCARGRRRRPRAPACARSSGQTSFSPSVAPGLVRRRRPPTHPAPSSDYPPLPPGSPAPPIPVRGGRFQGTAAA